MKSQPSDRIKIPPGFWAGLQVLGISAHEVVRKARLPLAVITDQAVTTSQYYAIWQAYSDLAGDTAKGIIKLATVFETAKYPPTVLATYHARDYRDALSRMARYKQLCPLKTYVLQRKASAVQSNWIGWMPGNPVRRC